MTRPSLREWVTAYTRSPQGPAFLPLSLTTFVEKHRQLDLSTGRSGPHDFAVRIDAVRPTVSIASTAAHLHVRDDAYVPLDEAGCNKTTIISEKTKEEYFSKALWTRIIRLNALAK
ncbi:MAG: hypothetical protein JO141_03365 [Bradyrhizobium sp.]|nr:hypothetical protein [Bradyrhizobium sp.]